jgi:uncharacterized membrane protein YhhN
VKRWWAFVPYAVVAAVHLVALFSGATAVSDPTKGLLMPALLLALLVAIPSRRGRVALWAGLGILFSWAGDLLLSTPGDTGFVAGLGAFLLAHIAYLVLFLRPLKARRIPRLGLLYLIWWAALLVLLAPHLGVLLIPVAVYGLVLAASTTAALGTDRVVAIGGFLFLASDTLLAFKMFWPDFAVWEADFLIMLGYLAGQGLIILGAVRHRRAGVPAG